MFKIFALLTLLAFLSVIFTLVMGALSMKGKEIADREKSNLWMRRRVAAQICAIILLFITFSIRNG